MSRRLVDRRGDAVEELDPVAFAADRHAVRPEDDRVVMVLRHVEPRILQRLQPGLTRIDPDLREQLRQARQPVDMVEMRVRQQHPLHGNAAQRRQPLQQRLHVAAVHDPARILPLLREDIRPRREHGIDDVRYPEHAGLIRCRS